jgi:hypothetical protein
MHQYGPHIFFNLKTVFGIFLTARMRHRAPAVLTAVPVDQWTAAINLYGISLDPTSLRSGSHLRRNTKSRQSEDVVVARGRTLRKFFRGYTAWAEPSHDKSVGAVPTRLSR